MKHSVSCNHTYDAWGAPTSITNANGNDITSSTHIANINPIRYRGYYYDKETGLYYISSRYYDPEICRFINTDTTDILTASPGALTDKNLFAYCDNNPVVRADHAGELWNFIIGAVVGGVVGGIVAGITSYRQTGKIDLGSVGINFAVGALSGTIAATGLGMFAQAGLTAAVSGVGNVAEQIHVNKGLNNFNHLDVVGSALLGAGTSLLGTGVGKLVGNKIYNSGIYMLNKGRDKLLTGMVRRYVGQSHSALIR